MASPDSVAGAIAAHVTADVRRESYRMLRQALRGVAGAAASGTIGLTNGVKAFAIAYDKEFANPSDVEDAYKRVAGHMRDRVRKSYSASFKGGPGQYRVGGQGDVNRTTAGGFLSRYSGGSLKNAIFDDRLVQVDSKAIRYVDEGRLTKEAAHWARMNFGALPQTRTPKKFRVVFDGRVVDTLGFEALARPAFYLPPGTWRDAAGNRVAPDPGSRGQHMFFPSKRQDSEGRVRGTQTARSVQGSRKGGKLRPAKSGLHKKRTRGIKAREFLDAGLAAYQDEMPKELDKLLDKWYEDALKKPLLPSRMRVVAGTTTAPLSARY